MPSMYSDMTANHRGGENAPNQAQHDHQLEDLPALQVQGVAVAADAYEPIVEDEPDSFDLVAPPQEINQSFSLEKQTVALFSKAHLKIIFSDPSLLLRFTAFISAHRPDSIPLLVYYLDALKALRAIEYANAVTGALESLDGHEFTEQTVEQSRNTSLEKRVEETFEALVDHELPAYITHLYINVVSISISKRIMGTLPPHLMEASEGLAEVFCVTDPSRKDNPIIFCSEEFLRTTQYGTEYVLGRNCRFLQGPKTNPKSVLRLREAIAAGKQHQEVFLNYRRDGSPFVNLLMMAPLCDSRGQVRYFIGAQVDVSGLVKNCAEMESLERLLQTQGDDAGIDENGDANVSSTADNEDEYEERDEFRSLSEMFNPNELSTVRNFGGMMHTGGAVEGDDEEEEEEDRVIAPSQRPRLMIEEHPLRSVASFDSNIERFNGKLSGVYKHYLLIRPYPSLRILFASPSQRMPGMLQSPFLSRVGGSPHIRDELSTAFAEGRPVTAKVRWISGTRPVARPPGEDGGLSPVNNNPAVQGKLRWIHCTPLVGAGGSIGVWMVVMVIPDEEVVAAPTLPRQTVPKEVRGRQMKPAPPVQMPVPERNPMREYQQSMPAGSERGGSVARGRSSGASVRYLGTSTSTRTNSLYGYQSTDETLRFDEDHYVNGGKAKGLGFNSAQNSGHKWYNGGSVRSFDMYGGRGRTSRRDSFASQGTESLASLRLG